MERSDDDFHVVSGDILEPVDEDIFILRNLLNALEYS